MALVAGSALAVLAAGAGLYTYFKSTPVPKPEPTYPTEADRQAFVVKQQAVVEELKEVQSTGLPVTLQAEITSFSHSSLRAAKRATPEPSLTEILQNVKLRPVQPEPRRAPEISEFQKALQSRVPLIE